MKYALEQKEFDALRDAITPDEVKKFLDSRVGRYLLAWIAVSIEYMRNQNDTCDNAQHEHNKAAIGFGKAFLEVLKGLENKTQETNHE